MNLLRKMVLAFLLIFFPFFPGHHLLYAACPLNISRGEKEVINYQIQGSEALIKKDRLNQPDARPGIYDDLLIPRTSDGADQILVLSSRPGMGKSFFSFYLAAFMAEEQSKVLLTDLDEEYAFLTRLVDSVIPEGRYENNSASADKNGLVAALSSGLDFLPYTILDEFCRSANGNQADCLRMLKAELLPYRYTVIDTRTGLTEMNLSLVAQCNKIIMISTPDATSIYDTYSLIKVANSYFDDKNIFLVLNQVIDRESSLDAYRELNSTLKYFLNSGIRLLGIIPEDISVADIQNYLIQPDPGTFKSPALKIIREISSRIREFRYVGTSLRG